MSLPKPPKQLAHTLRSGKTVCYDHRLRHCDVCIVDLKFDESDDDEPGYYGSDGSEGRGSHFDLDDDEEEEEKDDRVFILSGSSARFIPQWDEQVLGQASITKIEKESNKPPKPHSIGSIRTHYCSACQLTWLEGDAGKEAATDHPSHHSRSHGYADTSRSLVVFTDGACPKNGTRDARGGLGVFFGHLSKYNLSERLAISVPPTNQKAALEAVARAMETVRTKVLTGRRQVVVNCKGGHDSRAVFDVMHMRLIILTDSSYVVECMCQHIVTWRKNMEGALVTKTGKPVVKSQAFLRLQSEVEKLSLAGVQVAYCHVGKGENLKAERLAKGSLLVV